jgi:hypothetical protein
MKIAFGCIFYPLMMGRYMLEALLRRDDVEIWTYGPFTGNWIPWADGMYLKDKYVYKPDLPLPIQPGALPVVHYQQVENKAPWQPDLWLEVNAGLQTFGKPETGAPYAIIGTDPHVLGGLYDNLRPKADFFFNMQTPYMRPGDLYLPYAYDPIWHAPSNIPMIEREYDAALIGLQYQNRNSLMGQLRSAGLNIFYQLGIVYDEAREIYHNTKVGINWSSLQDTTARVFELMAMGCAPVLNRVPDLMKIFSDGEDFLGFDSAHEARAHVLNLVNDTFAAERIAKNAQMAVRPHTWDARMDDVLKKVNLISS